MQPIVLKDAAHQPLYEQIYRALKENILSGAFESGEKLPSKRALAKQLSVSLITVENAYAQLAAEGYLYAVQKKGYYVAALETPPPPAAAAAPRYHLPEHERFAIDLRVDRPDAGRFPTAAWSRLTRRVLTEQGDGIFRSGEFSGEQALRLQIAAYLRRSRFLDVSPDRILVAAGTESLCDILVKLLGAYRVFALEDPGYRKVSDLYRAAGARCFFLPMDADGIRLDALRASPAEVLHVSPNHQYPTGILTPASRRFELLAWAGERSGRYLIEDDYDSELRFDARPLPPLIAEDRSEKVIYMNTFSKTIAPSLRIGYLVLPAGLMDLYCRRFSGFSCTVSVPEQLTLASFMESGMYERHIGRMKKFYNRRRLLFLEKIRQSPLASFVHVEETAAGLHFLLTFRAPLAEERLRADAKEQGIAFAFLSDFYRRPPARSPSSLLINYGGLREEDFDRVLAFLCDWLQKAASAT